MRPRGIPSRLASVVETLARWTESSVLCAVLTPTRLLTGVLGSAVLVSVVAVYRSQLGAGVKFLSFALLFVAIAALVGRVVEPPAE